MSIYQDPAEEGILLAECIAEIQRLKDELKTAVMYLKQGKLLYSPRTTNSLVDDFLKKHVTLEKE